MESGVNFAFETTLASKSYANLINKARQDGYVTFLIFFWLPSPELAILRVANRVKEGGHNVAEEIIRRRYQRGLMNLFRRYLPIFDSWMVVDNSGDPYQMIAEGTHDKALISDSEIWMKLRKQYG